MAPTAAREVVASVGVDKTSALWLKDGVEAGDKHVGWDASQHRLVDSLKYLPRRGAWGCSHASKQGTGRAHHESRWHSFTRCVPHSEAHPTVIQLEELVEVSSHLPGWLVVGRDLPAL